MKFRWDKKYLYWGITAFCVIAAAVAFYLLLTRLSDIGGFLARILNILTPIIYGIVIAYLLSPVVRFLENAFLKKLGSKLFRKNVRHASIFARGTATAISLVLLVGFVALLLVLILPQITASVQTMISNMSGYVKSSIEWIKGLFSRDPDMAEWITETIESVTNYVTNWLQNDLLPTANSLLPSVTTGVLNLVQVVFNFVVGVAAAAYLLYNKETFIAQAKKITYTLLPVRTANNMIGGMSYTHKVFSRTILGKLMDSLIIGLLCLILLLIFRIPYAGLVSLIVGVTNIIPFFGPFIGGVPSAFLILLVDPGKCLLFVIIIVVLQQLDGNFIGPRILGSTVGMRGFWIMFATLFVGGLFGPVGMVIGVPLFAVLFTALRTWSDKKLLKKNLPRETEAYKGLSAIDEQGAPVYSAAPTPEPPQPEQPQTKDGE